jgi:vanillate O-demethylase monooxygenase subunit
MPPVPRLTEDAVRVADVADLDAANGVLPVRVDGTPWVVVRLGETVAAFRDRCPHRRVPLSEGRVVPTDSGPALECPYHGWSFASSGRCVRIPALGARASVPKGMRVRTARITEHDGALWLLPEPSEDAAAP